MEQKRVFIGSSRESKPAVEAFVAALSEALGPGFLVVPWWTAPEWDNLRSALASLQTAVRAYDYAAFVCWPDDQAVIRKKDVWVTRDNTIFEFGLFLTVLGNDRTFVVQPVLPGAQEFHMLSDIGTVYRQFYDCEFEHDGRFRHVPAKMKEAADEVGRRIRAHALTWSAVFRDSNTAKNQLKIELQGLTADASGSGGVDASDTRLMSYTRDRIGELVRLKAAATSRTLWDAVRDLVLYFRHVDDMLDVEQLAKKQRYDASANEITEVWVLADEPLEFIGVGTGEVRRQLPLLKETIKHNLENGVQYHYLVPREFRVEKARQFFVEELRIKGPHLKAVNVVLLETKSFNTFFTAHKFGAGKEVYMSALMEERNDLLIKVSPLHEDRIFDRLRQLRGVESDPHGFQVLDFVHS